MSRRRFTFSEGPSFEAIEATLLLALWASDSIFGEPAVRLDLSYTVDENTRVIEIDHATQIGRTLSRLFLGFARKEYGDDGVQVERVDEPALS